MRVAVSVSLGLVCVAGCGLDYREAEGAFGEAEPLARDASTPHDAVWPLDTDVPDAASEPADAMEADAARLEGPPDAGPSPSDASSGRDAAHRADAAPQGPDGGWLPSSTVLHVFRGDLHSHSSHSDDAAANSPAPGAPSRCFARARTRGLDFLFVTDHANYSSDGEWATCKRDAAAASSPEFLGACGLETSMRAPSGSVNNHANVFFFGGSWKDYEWFKTQAAFFQELAQDGTILAQFNHPARADFLWEPPVPTAATKAQLHLLEFNGAPTTAAAVEKYVQFLDAGWLVAPTWNSDSHSGGETARTALWMDALGPASLRAAVVGHRSFVHESHDDRAGTLRFYADERWMGAELRASSSVRLRVVATHPEGVARVDFVGPQGRVLKSVPCAAETHCERSEAFAPPPRWVFVQARQSNGRVMVSAPVRFE